MVPFAPCTKTKVVRTSSLTVEESLLVLRFWKSSFRLVLAVEMGARIDFACFSNAFVELSEKFLLKRNPISARTITVTNPAMINVLRRWPGSFWVSIGTSVDEVLGVSGRSGDWGGTDVDGFPSGCPHCGQNADPPVFVPQLLQNKVGICHPPEVFVSLFQTADRAHRLFRIADG